MHPERLRRQPRSTTRPAPPQPVRGEMVSWSSDVLLSRFLIFAPAFTRSREGVVVLHFPRYLRRIHYTPASPEFVSGPVRSTAFSARLCRSRHTRPDAVRHGN